MYLGWMVTSEESLELRVIADHDLRKTEHRAGKVLKGWCQDFALYRGRKCKLNENVAKQHLGKILYVLLKTVYLLGK